MNLLNSLWTCCSCDRVSQDKENKIKHGFITDLQSAIFAHLTVERPEDSKGHSLLDKVLVLVNQAET